MERQQEHHQGSGWRRQAAWALLAAGAVLVLGWQSLQDHERPWLLVIVLLAAAASVLWAVHQRLQAAERSARQAQAEREALAVQVRVQDEQLQRLRLQRAQLLSGLAHSLRQPLWALRLYTDTLLQREQAADTAELLRRQAAAIAEANRLLDQSSRLAMVERGQLDLHKAPVDAREVLDVVAAHLGRPGRMRVHGRRILLQTDHTHFASLVQLLAAHAQERATAARGEQEARVVLAVRPRRSGCAIEVLDNGRAIAPDRRAQAFEPYAVLDDSGGHQGLGLALAHGLAARLGMTLELRGGTGFRLQVPWQALTGAASRPEPQAG